MTDSNQTSPVPPRPDDAIFARAIQSLRRHEARARLAQQLREGIVDSDQMEDAMRLLQTIIELGMELFRDIRWRDGHSTLLSLIAAQTGVDLAV